MTKYLLAHDLGTSGNKATLFTDDGDLVGSITCAYETHYSNGTWAEQNPNDWWQAVCESTQRLIQGISPAEIAAVALSGQMMGCTCVDQAGRALRPSILYCDQRSEAEAASILTQIEMQEAYRIVGHRIAPVYALEKLMWVKANEPQVYLNTYKSLCAKDYINFHLTGEFGTDFSDASGTNAFDLNTMQWSDRLIDIAGVERSFFPEVFPSTHILGEVTPQAAAATGLKAGTPVAVGGGDGSCAGVGVGCIQPGSAYNYLGSSSWIAMTVERPIVDPAMRTMNWAHVVPGYLHPSGSVQTAGAAYQWLKNEICRDETQRAQAESISAYVLIDQLAQASLPGAGGIVFLPYLMGERSPRWNPNARGALVGMTLSSKREDLVRAVMEGITYNLGVIVDIFRNHIPVDAITVIGGGAKSRLWLQMMADIYNAEISRPNYLEEATSMGAAVVGGVAIGVFSDFQVIDRFIRIEETIWPNADNQRLYQKPKQIFEQTYHALCDVFDAMVQSDQ